MHSSLSWVSSGNLVVNALASVARGPRFAPRGRRGKISESEHVFRSAISRDDTKSARRPLDRDVYWRPPVQGESSPVHVKEPFSSLHDYMYL